MKKIFYTVAAIFGLIFFIGVFSGESEPEDYRTSSNAIMYAEDRIESLLKSPSTADFSGGRSVVTREGDAFIVKGYVDSQNGFGAMIRSNYKVKVEFIGDNVRTSVIEFE